MAKPATNTYGPAISIGASKETVEEVHATINDILASGAEQETMRKALDVLGTACNVHGTTISDCTFTQGPK